VRPALPDLAAEFAATAEKAVVAAGGADLARRAEADPARRPAVAALLDGLGIADLDPRADVETAAAAAELCRVAGRYAVPYPLVAALLAGPTGRPLSLVPAARPMADHGDLFPAWTVVDPTGAGRPARPAGARLASKLGPFVTDLEADGDARPGGRGDR